MILDTEDAYTENYTLGEFEVFYVEKGERCSLLHMVGDDSIFVKSNIAKLELEKNTFC